MRNWDVGDAYDLKLFNVSMSKAKGFIPLFYKCAFLRGLGCLSSCYLEKFHHVCRNHDGIAHKRTAKSVIGRLLLAATSYFIWMERNNRLFKKVKKKPEEIRDMVMITVRFKLLTLRFKNKLKVAELLSRWKMPSNFRLYG
ncbi:hypothetical protein Tco_0811220 [Tanacetum coccineum]